MEIGQLVLVKERFEWLQKQKENKEIVFFVRLYLLIKICEFWLILLDCITFLGLMSHVPVIVTATHLDSS